MNKTKLPYRYFAVFFIVLFISCTAPQSKDEYITRFESFVERVRKNYKNYTKSDWQWADAQFNKYSGEWYRKFKGEYSLTNQITIKALILEYNSLKNNEDFGEIVKKLFNEDLNKFKEKVDTYKEKDFDEDLDKLIEGATEIGDSAVKVLQDVIDNLEKTF